MYIHGLMSYLLYVEQRNGFIASKYMLSLQHVVYLKAQTNRDISSLSQQISQLRTCAYSLVVSLFS